MQNLTTNIINKNNIKIISFNLGNEEFAIDIKYIQEIIKSPNITPIPLTKNYILGVINVRGEIIPVIDAKLKMNIKLDYISQKKEENISDTDSSNLYSKKLEYTTNLTRIIILSHENRKVGIKVDSMNKVITASSEQISQPTLISEDASYRFTESIYAIDDKLVAIININALLDTK
ncbi:MAG: chemotaxis protein CheW [Candidatus Sericytochromatia bacterium]|nr:chemotaxis protein CheW [Candidatus Sericytochromatia bacterium]